jgi:hypothetical protein
MAQGVCSRVEASVDMSMSENIRAPYISAFEALNLF